MSQQRDAGRQKAQVTLKWGKLRLKTIALGLPQGVKVGSVVVTVAGKAVEAGHVVTGGRITVTLAEEANLQPGQAIEIAVA